ncbi:MAG: hypothetical protein N2446_01275 [Elusimicrobiales bacterium]|nr:hypothetical protein [Elusimicrobiales bacterium]
MKVDLSLLLFFVLLIFLPQKLQANFFTSLGIDLNYLIIKHNNKQYFQGFSPLLELEYREEKKLIGFRYSNLVGESINNDEKGKSGFLKQLYGAMKISEETVEEKPKKLLCQEEKNKKKCRFYNLIAGIDKINISNYKKDILNVGIQLSSQLLGENIRLSILLNEKKIGFEIALNLKAILIKREKEIIGLKIGDCTSIWYYDYPGKGNILGFGLGLFYSKESFK